ncbi:hypothetical protein GCM10011531_07240 [Aquaticitalea lipolytica]|uniref:Uncharacterized protein n=1 Tax=Aquaticitalea lipolytica TaxID=1247562 RepID=A0A8J2TPG6_9FLAO|nr:hypothetical protein [Aquaticitalea lipolytica]GFZ79856.1 hypothetical protein GCM10011531_07240 [Aquaticitalea lipolytica]
MGIKNQRPHLSSLETGWNKFWKDFWSGTKPTIEASWCKTGRINQGLKTKITISINSIISHHRTKFKIGKTGDAYIRGDKKDYRNDYHFMYLLYKSKSSSYVSELEEHYIEKYMKSHPKANQNKRVRAPGKKMYSYDGYYYLYIVCTDE